MDNLPTFLQYSLEVIIYLKYFFVFIGAIVEGPILMIASGFLLHEGVFNIVPLFISIALGDLVGDATWYYIGYYFANRFISRFGKFFGINYEIFEKVKIFFHKHHAKILFFSKLIMGFGLAIYILMVAGATRVNFKKYMILNAIGEVFFVAMLLSIGYYFGRLYHYFTGGFKIASLVFLLIIVVLFIFNIQKIIRQKIIKSI